MKKIILFSVFALFTGITAFAQSNSFGFSKEKMNGEFVQTVSQDNGKTIYAVDLAKFSTAESKASFLENLYASDKVFAVSYPDAEQMLFIAGHNSVITEAEVKVLVLDLKSKSVSVSASDASKTKFSSSK